MNQDLINLEEFNEPLLRQEYPNLNNITVQWVNHYYEEECDHDLTQLLQALESNDAVIIGYRNERPWFIRFEPDLFGIELFIDMTINPLFPDGSNESIISVIYHKESLCFTHSNAEVGCGRNINEVLFHKKLHEVTVEHCKPTTDFTESKYNQYLKPCPFCGKRAILRENAVNLVFCEDTVNCGAQIEQSEGESPEDTANYCISAWNNRSPERY